jgi:hypothetical protein
MSDIESRVGRHDDPPGRQPGRTDGRREGLAAGPKERADDAYAAMIEPGEGPPDGPTQTVGA